MEFEAVIGLEVHVQLSTQSKMFTRAPAQYGAAPNTLTDPVVLGLPGALPVLNKEAIFKTIQLGLMFGCTIPKLARWDRKNYFYPDLPKNYQVTQQTYPLCIKGAVEIELEGPSRNIMGEHRKINLTRIHLEEDVGKLVHGLEGSFIDYNRAGTPLVEIVTEPDLRTPDEVFAFLTSLKMHLMYTGISDCDMEKGQLRCDANVSVRILGSTRFGTKVELKNLNSISGVRNGVTYEIERQISALRNHEQILQETRRWDVESNTSVSMRSKEKAQDYRYFPDPDLMPVEISEELTESLAKQLPELPFAKQERFITEYDLPYTITSVLCTSRPISDFFEQALTFHNNPKAIANLIANDLLRELSSNNGGMGSMALTDCKITPQIIAELVKLSDTGEISKQIAQDLLVEIFKTGEAPTVLIDRKGLRQRSDTSELKQLCQQAIEHHTKAVEEFKQGKLSAINAFKGFVMKATHGKANPLIVDTLLNELLK